MQINKNSPKANRENICESGLTIPIRFSRQRITELLVAAEQTASNFPCKRNWTKLEYTLCNKTETRDHKIIKIYINW